VVVVAVVAEGRKVHAQAGHTRHVPVRVPLHPSCFPPLVPTEFYSMVSVVSVFAVGVVGVEPVVHHHASPTCQDLLVGAAAEVVDIDHTSHSEYPWLQVHRDYKE